MNWSRVGLIMARELRDQLRDRRTLFMVVVLPMLLYPALGLGMMQLTLLFREQPRTVVILGAEHLPDEPELFRENRFRETWFRPGSDPGRLRVVSDRPPDQTAGSSDDSRRTELLQAARNVQETLERDGAESAGRVFDTGGLEAVLLVPSGFRDSLIRVQEDLQLGRERGVHDWPKPKLVYNKAADKSMVTWSRTTDVLERWEEAILADLLKRGRLDAAFTHPALGDPVDVSLPAQVSASLWGRMFPAFLVIMAVTGAFYPAIDLVAGEKERGTMETLLICPATRLEIVLGKFFTVLLFSISTAMLNLTSMGFTGKQLLAMVPAGASAAGGEISLPPPMTLLWLGLLLIPLAALFSALALALATFARSSKEGQYYLTPLLMVTMGLTVFCLSPGTELSPQLSLLPVVGPALLLKSLLLAPTQGGAVGAYLLPVLIASCTYSGLALWWAVELFHREDVLFREGERFELVPWLKSVWSSRGELPKFAQGVACFALIMLLQFFASVWLSRPPSEASAGERGNILLRQLLAQQGLIIAGPAVVLALLLTRNPLRTLRLTRTPVGWIAAGGVLAVCLHPLVVELQERLRWFFGELPPAAHSLFETLSSPDVSPLLLFLAIAVAPALCEELAFRGFLLSAFSERGRTTLAVFISSLMFGVVHMIPQQVLNAALLGLLLGWLAIRSGSLWPGLTFHLVNNVLALLHGRFGPEWGARFGIRWLFGVSDGSLRYSPAVALIGLGLAAFIVIGLHRQIPPDRVQPLAAD